MRGPVKVQIPLSLVSLIEMAMAIDAKVYYASPESQVERVRLGDVEFYADPTLGRDDSEAKAP